MPDHINKLREAIHQRQKSTELKKRGNRTSIQAESSQLFDGVSRTDKREYNMNNSQQFLQSVKDCLKNVDLDENAKSTIIRSIMLNFEESTTTSLLQQRLDILFQHEHKYLNLVKEFKEEIKFIDSIQGDLRKERAKFFSDTLKDVTAAMKDAQVSDDVANQWLQELVGTYTRSLDLSSGLIEEHTADTICQIKKQAQDAVNVATTTAPDSQAD